jgi:uncharacterized membrane protein YozB (DUF420 family)
LSYTDLPLLNALLNTTSTVFLLLGYFFVRRKNQRAHHRCMTVAVSASVAFLISYLVYHFEVGSVGFKGEGMVRIAYFSILVSHSILAVILPVIVPITYIRALRGNYAEHRKIARFTFPVWLYVSFTGVLVYLFLYRFYV